MRLSCVALCVALFAPLVDAHDEHGPHKVTLLIGNAHTAQAIQAIEAFRAADPGLDHHATFRVVCEATLGDVSQEELASSDVLLLDIHTHNLDEGVQKGKKLAVVKGVVSRGGVVLAIGESLTPNETYEAMGVAFDPVVRDYWNKQGWRNLKNLLMVVVGKYAHDPDQRPDPPEDCLRRGYYCPTEDGGRVFADHAAFLAFAKERGLVKDGAPWVAVLSFGSYFYDANAEVENLLHGRLRAEGLNVLCAFGFPEAPAVRALLLDEHGKARVDVAVSFLFRFTGFDASLTLAEIDVPVIKMISTYGRTEEDWRGSRQGLSIFEGSFNVAVPEIAGLVQPTLVAVERRGLDPETVRLEPTWLVHLLEAIDHHTISGKMAKDLFVESVETQQDPRQLIERRGLRQIVDDGALTQLADEVIAQHPKSVEDYRHGKANALMFFVGQCMRRSQGKANPQQVTEILKQTLSKAGR